jgi:hypothetical protein
MTDKHIADLSADKSADNKNPKIVCASLMHRLCVADTLSKSDG